MPDDVFYEKQLQKTSQDFSMGNIGRYALNLSADSRPATEAFFISSVVLDNSSLFLQKLEFLINSVSLY